ncbi:MAG: hypothetical protein IPJ20_10405 [Flammeovirgaceae bacterium]|nr:hypothetical protein [Flammeovirgaceae bacterium]
MTTGGCIEDPLWLQTAEVLHKDSPDYGLAINMAKIYAKNGNVDKAESLANEAITIAPTAANKATANLFVGDLLAQKAVRQPLAKHTGRQQQPTHPAKTVMRKSETYIWVLLKIVLKDQVWQKIVWFT